MADLDAASKTVALALGLIVLGGLSAWYIWPWLRELSRAARFDTRALHAELDQLINDTNEDNELHIHLLNQGFTEHDLQVHHMVVGRRTVYTIPREYFIAQIRQASELQRRALLGLAGQRQSAQT